MCYLKRDEARGLSRFSFKAAQTAGGRMTKTFILSLAGYAENARNMLLDQAESAGLISGSRRRALFNNYTYVRSPRFQMRPFRHDHVYSIAP